MKKASTRFAGWMAAVGAVLALVGCGGGDREDARSGTYTMTAANAREYSLTLDFDAQRYHVVGNGVDQSGVFTQSGNVYLFQPGNAASATGASTARFTPVTDGIVGEFVLPEGALPFVAARSFDTTVASAAGTYNFAGRSVDTAGGLPAGIVQQAQLTADGHLLTCDDPTLYDIASCPAASITTGTVTVSGDTFTSTTANGTMAFHVAQLETEKLFLSADAGSGTTRRFIVGAPAATSFTPATFLGGTTEPSWGTISVTSSSYTSTGLYRNGATATRSAPAQPAGAGTLASVLAVNTSYAGNFYGIHTSAVGVLVSSPSNNLAPGLMAIGATQ
jgi:hypothetical protein